MKNFNDKIKALKFIKHLGTKDEILLANGDVINVNDLPGGGGGDIKPDAQGTLTFNGTKKVKS